MVTPGREMTDQQTGDARAGFGADGPEAGRESVVLSAATFLLRRWRSIAMGAVGATLVAAAMMPLLPRHFTARALLALPQSQADPRAQLLSAASPTSIMFPGIGTNPNTRLVGAVLKSRSLADSIQRRFGDIDLVTNENTVDGSILVEVTARDAAAAAQAANGIPTVLNAILSRVGAETNRRRQEFLEAQIARARSQLGGSEDALVRFQKAQGAPEIEEQARQTVQAALQLQEEIAQKETQVRLLARTATRDNPQFRAAEAELEAWRHQLAELTNGTGEANRVLLSLKESPELKATTLRLLRSYGENEQIYSSLMAALTQAKIEGQNDIPALTIIDSAVPPAAPSSPKYWIVLPMACLLGLAGGLASALAADALERTRHDPAAAGFFAAWNGFKTDLRRLIPGRPRARKAAAADDGAELG